MNLPCAVASTMDFIISNILFGRQEEERRRREEEMMRQREMEEQMRRKREESYRMGGFMDNVSLLYFVLFSPSVWLLEKLWCPFLFICRFYH